MLRASTCPLAPKRFAFTVSRTKPNKREAMLPSAMMDALRAMLWVSVAKLSVIEVQKGNRGNKGKKGNRDTREMRVKEWLGSEKCSPA